jgi:8-amino-7-oxononanoate synthase
VDVLQKCAEDTRYRELRQANLYTYYRGISSPQDPVVTMNGQKVVMLGSNNYLGLTNHPAVKEASVAAVVRYGTGCADPACSTAPSISISNLRNALPSSCGPRRP